MRREGGGAMAKLLVFLVLMAVLASAALYSYGKWQHPLAASDATVAVGRQVAIDSIALEPDQQIAVATIIRNDGRLPVTLEGLAETAPGKEQPVVVTGIVLGDGETPDPAAGAPFVPTPLEPRTGVGVVVTLAVNPAFACSRLSDVAGEPTTLPPITMRFTTYGVETTQTIPLDEHAPTVAGLTRTACEQLGGGAA